MVVGQRVHNRHNLLARHGLSALDLERHFDQADLRVLQRLRDHGQSLLEVLDEDRARQLGVGTAPGLTEPVLLGLNIGVIPPTAPAHRVPDGEPAIQLVLVTRPARHLDVVGTSGHVRPPVFLALSLNPLVNQGVSIPPFVDKVGQPDVVIEAGGLPGDLFWLLQADGPRDVIHMTVAMAQATHPDGCLARHERATGKDRVTGLNEPGIRADFLHVPRHVQHQVQLLEAAQVHAAVVVAVFGSQFAYAPRVVMSADIGCVDDKVGVLQGRPAVGSRLEAEISSQFTSKALRKLHDNLHGLGPDVHKGHVAAGQALGSAQVIDQPG